ncbi:MAG TPA: hypothetical protein VMF03_10865 [Steroidobacteraceae bacterium]|nr:hypothetical protein [Steroidobacteraceae bacterium]
MRWKLPLLGAMLTAAAITRPAAAATPDDACSFLTAAQVSSALGTAVAAGTYVTPTSRITCTWNATRSGGGTVTLHVQSAASYDAGKRLASLASASAVTSASGIGDDAYYFTSGTLSGLLVKKGMLAFKVAIYVHNLPAAQQQAIERMLALQVAQEL